MDETEELKQARKSLVLSFWVPSLLLASILAGLDVLFYFKVPGYFLAMTIVVSALYVLFLCFLLPRVIFSLKTTDEYLRGAFEKGVRTCRTFRKIYRFGKTNQNIYLEEAVFSMRLDRLEEADACFSHISDSRLLINSDFERCLLLLRAGDINAAYSLYLQFNALGRSSQSETVQQEMRILSGLFHHIQKIPLDHRETVALTEAVYPLIPRLAEKDFGTVTLLPAPSASDPSALLAIPITTPHRTLMIVLFVLTLLAIPLGFLLSAIIGASINLSDPTVYSLSWYWLCFLLLLVPILGIVFGAIIKHQNPKAKTLKNIISGAIVIPVLVFLGCLSFMDTAKTDFAIATYLEEAVSFPLPDNGKARYDQDRDASGHYGIISDGILVFTDASESETFNASVSISLLWVDGGSPLIKDFIPSLLWKSITNGATSLPVMLFDASTKTYNSVPSPASNHLYALASNPQKGWLSFVEYTYLG